MYALLAAAAPTTDTTLIDLFTSYGIPAAVGAAILVIVQWGLSFLKKSDKPSQ